MRRCRQWRKYLYFLTRYNGKKKKISILLWDLDRTARLKDVDFCIVCVLNPPAIKTMVTFIRWRGGLILRFPLSRYRVVIRFSRLHCSRVERSLLLGLFFFSYRITCPPKSLVQTLHIAKLRYVLAFVFSLTNNLRDATLTRWVRAVSSFIYLVSKRGAMFGHPDNRRNK